MRTTAETARFARLERLIGDVTGTLAAVNDAEAIDNWALLVATMRLERALDAVGVVLKAGQR